MGQELKFEINEKNISTFMTPGWRLMTVPKEQHKLNLKRDGDIKLKFEIGEEECFENLSESGQKILRRIKDEVTDSYVICQYRVKNNILKCKFSPRAFEYLMAIFVASAVNYREVLLATGEEKKEIKKNFKNPITWFDKNKEAFSLSINASDKTATLTHIETYEDNNNPFLEYSRKAMLQTSYSQVLGKDIFGMKQNKIRDFYCTSIHGWTDVKELKEINEGEVKNVIYMLYDENKSKFYIGRADDLKTRLMQHQTKADDPIPEFTHYRYSIIDEQYVEYSYIIEAAAIHDCAAILEMQKRKKLKASLQNFINRGDIEGDLNRIKIVNNIESQAQRRNKKE